MARIYTDGTVRASEAAPADAGDGLIARMRTTYLRLRLVFGEPEDLSTGDPLTGWRVITPAGVACVYDFEGDARDGYRHADHPDDPISYSVSGPQVDAPVVFAWIVLALAAAGWRVEPGSR